VLVAIPAQAAWELDGDKSAVSFVSTKAINVAEVHKFVDLSGGIESNGQVNIAIGLASVDTGIELRDDRMRDMLFETGTFGMASISAKVDGGKLDGMEPGSSVDMTVEGVLSLHGESRPLVIEAVVARVGDHSLLVTSKKPVIINAPEYKLGEGVEALREIAGLPSISLAVPVSFVLAFNQQ
jgi:polyisoprenoid-binding protein YceI